MKIIRTKYSVLVVLLVVISLAEFGSCRKSSYSAELHSDELIITLGRRLFFDNTLSNPSGQSCGSCHATSVAFSDPAHNIVSPGVVPGLFGNRNAPVAMYAQYVPALHYSIDDSSYVGGLFWDGRVNTLEEQAQKPFLNPLEMGNTDAAMVVAKLQRSENLSYYQLAYGNITDVNTAFANIAAAIATYERSEELSPFTSKYDYYLAGKATLTDAETRGMLLFTDTLKGMCANCHLITPDEASGKVLFTDFSYENDGVPKNPYNPYYTLPGTYNAAGQSYIDLGLGDFINDSAFYGTFRTPTLRNIALTAPYFHNGCFGTLEQVVHFYNTRDVTGSGFAAPEYASNIDHTEEGNLKLTPQDEADIVSFLKTLTDGYQP